MVITNLPAFLPIVAFSEKVPSMCPSITVKSVDKSFILVAGRQDGSGKEYFVLSKIINPSLVVGNLWRQICILVVSVFHVLPDQETH